MLGCSINSGWWPLTSQYLLQLTLCERAYILANMPVAFTVMRSQVAMSILFNLLPRSIYYWLCDILALELLVLRNWCRDIHSSNIVNAYA